MQRIPELRKIRRHRAKKLLQKMADLVASCEEKYGIRVIYDGKVRMRHMKRLRKKLYALKEKEGIEFVHGTGKRKSELQKSMETLEEYLDRLKKYTQPLHICGSGNSYSKTDHDAAFMHMKEDAMGNGRLKPAYTLCEMHPPTHRLHTRFFHRCDIIIVRQLPAELMVVITPAPLRKYCRPIPGKANPEDPAGFFSDCGILQRISLLYRRNSFYLYIPLNLFQIPTMHPIDRNCLTHPGRQDIYTSFQPDFPVNCIGDLSSVNALSSHTSF